MGKGVWGIDVGKSSVKAVRMELRGGEAALTAVEVVPYESAGEGADLDTQIAGALQELKNACRMGKEPVLISLPGHSTFNRLIKLPPVEDEKIPEIVQYEAQSQIPFNIDEVIWSYQVIEREYQAGEEKEVILFAIKRDIVEQFLANIAPVGLNVEVIQFAPVALYNFLHHDQELAGAAIALDMGGDNTDLVILDGSKFWIRNLPITGNDITKALAKVFNLPFPEAEKLKLKAGQSQQAQKIFNAIQPVLRDLVGEIHRSIGYYKSISKTAKFEKIILLGNATKTLNFQKFVSQSLSTMGNLPAARLAKLGKVDAAGVDAGALNRHLGTLGAALGLGLQGLGLAANTVDLMPEAFKKKREVKRKQPMLVVAAALLYVLVLAAWLANSGEVSSLKKIFSEAQTAQQKYQDLKGRYDQAKDVGAVVKDTQTIASISSERDLVLRVMDAINACTPKNGELKEEKDKLWIVDWKMEEEPREAPKAEETASTPDQAGKLPLPAARNFRVEIEVVIVKRAEAGQGETFVFDTLLKPSLLAELGLKDRKRGIEKGVGWEISLALGTGSTDQDKTGPMSYVIDKPLPACVTGRSGYTPDDVAEKKFWRFRVQIVVPMGAKDRAAILAGAPTEPPKP
ncbi:MAG: type IV pilus assembly protein PilM [Planctomycetes bacterium]|nr:type IV pilus assembly protein PilM [Planctomycetota bacterium]